MAVGADAAQGQMTIEQLAAASGMSVRNIRAHQARGLLRAPEVRERIGYYGNDHLSRLRLIARLQADGFNLRAIERLLERTGGNPGNLMDLGDALSAPFESEQPAIVTTQELQERFGGAMDGRTLARSVSAGLLVKLDEDRYEVPLPSLLAVAEEVVARGVSVDHALTAHIKVAERCASIARQFVRLFLEDLWQPFAAAGYPEERWSEVMDSVQRLRPLAGQSVLTIFGLAMSAEVEKAFGRELERITRHRRH